jgi:hypothetical protein
MRMQNFLCKRVPNKRCRFGQPIRFMNASVLRDIIAVG